MYLVVINARTDRRAPSFPAEVDRFADLDAAQQLVSALELAAGWRGEKCSARVEWLPVVDRVEPTTIGTFRTARDGRSFVQVGRACVWGRRGESEGSLRLRKGAQIEREAAALAA